MRGLTLLAALAALAGFATATENVTVILPKVKVENVTVVNRTARHWHDQVPRKYWEHTLNAQQYYIQDSQPSQLASAALPRDLTVFSVSSSALPLQTITLQRKDLPSLTISSARSLNTIQPINAQPEGRNYFSVKQERLSTPVQPSEVQQPTQSIEGRLYNNQQVISTPTVTFQQQQQPAQFGRELNFANQPASLNNFPQVQQPLEAGRSYVRPIDYVQLQSTPTQSYQETKPIQPQNDLARSFVNAGQQMIQSTFQTLLSPSIQQDKPIQIEQARAYAPPANQQQYIPSPVQSFQDMDRRPMEHGRSFELNIAQPKSAPQQEFKPVQTEQARAFPPADQQQNIASPVQSFQDMDRRPMEAGRSVELSIARLQSPPQQEQGRALNIPLSPLPIQQSSIQIDDFILSQPVNKKIEPRVLSTNIASSASSGSFNLNSNNNQQPFNNFDLPLGRMDNSQNNVQSSNFEQSNSVLSSVPAMLTRMDNANHQQTMSNSQRATASNEFDQSLSGRSTMNQAVNTQPMGNLVSRNNLRAVDQSTMAQPDMNQRSNNIVFVRINEGNSALRTELSKKEELAAAENGRRTKTSGFRTSHQIPIASTQFMKRPIAVERDQDIRLQPVSLKVPASPATFNVINDGAIGDTRPAFPVSQGIPQTPVILADQVTATDDRPDINVSAIGVEVIEEQVEGMTLYVPDNIPAQTIQTPNEAPLRPAPSTSIQQPAWVSHRPATAVVPTQVLSASTTNAIRAPVHNQQQYVFDFMAPPISSDTVIALLDQAIPGVTYPALSEVPLTSFQCDKTQGEGYYADTETGCQVYHRCDEDGKMTDYLCPNRTIFNQVTLTCDWWYNYDCSVTNKFLTYANSRIQAHSENVPLFDSPPEGYLPAWAPLYHDTFFATQQKQLQDMQVQQMLLEAVPTPTRTKTYRKVAQPAWSKF